MDNLNRKAFFKKLMVDKEASLTAFPQLSEEIESVASKPNCAVCKRTLLNALNDLETKNTLLTNFMGVEVTMEASRGPLNKTDEKQHEQRRALAQQQNITKEVKVERIPKEEWEAWFTTNVIPDQTTLFPVFNTILDADTDTIIVSYVKVIRGK
jgi:hypothetical protein